MNRLSRPIQSSLMLAVPALVATSTFSMSGCAESAPEPPPQSAVETQASAPSLWRVPPGARSAAAVASGFDPTAQIAVINDGIDPDRGAALNAAVEQAGRTAEEARQRWVQSPAHEHDRWAVKWAAPLAEVRVGNPAAAVEYVWVRPVHWSPFRVEGVLASDPVNELASGRTLGELVSFPIEELADWVRYHTDDVDGPRDGGFTIDALTDPAMRPPSAVSTATPDPGGETNGP